MAHALPTPRWSAWSAAGAFCESGVTILSFVSVASILALENNWAKIMADAVNQEIVNDTTKLIMHRLIARMLSRDPLLVNRAKASLARTARHFPDRTFIAEWKPLLRLPVSRLRNLLTRRDQHMTRLRLSSPFVVAEGVDFTDPGLRKRIIQAAKRIAARGSSRRGRGADMSTSRPSSAN